MIASVRHDEATDDLVLPRSLGAAFASAADPLALLLPGLGQPIGVARDALTAVAAPRLRLRVVAADEALDAWVDDATFALLLPRADRPDELALRGYPRAHAPGVLAELVGLGPRRAHPAACGERRVAAPVLAQALAVDGPERAGLADVLVTPAWLWRVEARPPLADAPGRSLEVLDTAAGLWLVRADGGDAVLRATTPTRVFRGLSLLSGAPHGKN